VLDQGIDTSTAVGRMFFHILGAIAEFEHARSCPNECATASWPLAPAVAPAARSRSSDQVRSSWRARCTTRPARTANASTPSRRPPPSPFSWTHPADERQTSRSVRTAGSRRGIESAREPTPLTGVVPNALATSRIEVG
jgi:hypothetical protein